MQPTSKDPSQFEFPVGPRVPYEDPKRCMLLGAATTREACLSTKLCTKQGHGWKLTKGDQKDTADVGVAHNILEAGPGRAPSALVN